ncbi:Wzz/FepE/Etk N-terminal domain-containing protein, partial [Gilvibacter sp.]|uniref:Wzz/FepE/Etk N-terminal domain-containing protein n=1 Tax=Gilvibacter sp. TaxID=2729997 RepID=UPI0035BE4F8E
MSQTPIIEELFSILLKRKRFLLTVVLVFVLLGAVVAIFSPKEYVSKTIILPQISSSQGLGKKLGGFAKLVGLNFAENSKNEIFPTLYPVIANSIPFQKEVLSSHVVDAVTGDSLRVTE